MVVERDGSGYIFQNNGVRIYVNEGSMAVLWQGLWDMDPRHIERVVRQMAERTVEELGGSVTWATEGGDDGRVP